MLASLTVRDIVLIEKAELSFGPGLNVLTGETGAGKSILLDALGLATGGRGSGRAGLRPGVGQRPGAGQGAASAIFTVESGHAVFALLDENGLGADLVCGDTNEIILRRVVFADGHTRAFVNDSATGVALARAVGASLLEMHGQADDRGLFDNATHRGLLDAFGGHVALAVNVAALHRAHAAATGRLDELARAREAASAESDFLSYAADELAQLAPEEGEEDRLASERALLMNASRIAESLTAAVNFISGDGGAELTLASALRRLSRMAVEGRQAASAAETALDSALVLTLEAKQELDMLLARLEADSGRLEAAEERLFGLRAAARKYRVPVGKLVDLCAEFKRKLALLDEGTASVAAAEQDVVRTHAA
ncbi:MAG: AAA family ATPase, partial [Proteobacteria bacterium]|nr:AAA family ATPase [Pseudomonadota bacterium]